MRNRESARRSRQRKKQYVERLEAQVRHLSDRNSELDHAVEQLDVQCQRLDSILTSTITREGEAVATAAAASSAAQRGAREALQAAQANASELTSIREDLGHIRETLSASSPKHGPAPTPPSAPKAKRKRNGSESELAQQSPQQKKPREQGQVESLELSSRTLSPNDLAAAQAMVIAAHRPGQPNQPGATAQPRVPMSMAIASASRAAMQQQVLMQPSMQLLQQMQHSMGSRLIAAGMVPGQVAPGSPSLASMASLTSTPGSSAEETPRVSPALSAASTLAALSPVMSSNTTRQPAPSKFALQSRQGVSSKAAAAAQRNQPEANS